MGSSPCLCARSDGWMLDLRLDGMTHVSLDSVDSEGFILEGMLRVVLGDCLVFGD